jgi:hypothetical protein
VAAVQVTTTEGPGNTDPAAGLVICACPNTSVGPMANTIAGKMEIANLTNNLPSELCILVSRPRSSDLKRSPHV